MQTHQLVRGAAEVLTITTLRVNDVYKRVEESSYSAEPTLRFGIVIDVMDNGPDAAVVAVEYRPAEYGGTMVVDTKIITGNRALAIFPAQPEEVAQHMAALVEAAQRSEDSAREAYEKASAQVERVRAVRERVLANELAAPLTSTEPLPIEPDASDED